MSRPLHEASSQDLPPNSITAQRMAEIYTRSAAFYDSIAAERQAQGKELALQTLGRQSHETVLEVALGTGWALRRLIRDSGGRGVTGCDISDGMLEVAHSQLAEHGLAANLVRADANQLPFADSTFDCLLNTYTLEVLDATSTLKVLHEFRRVLKPGGRLVVANLTFGECLVDGLLSDAWSARFAQDPEAVSGAHPVLLEKSLQQCGFVAVTRSYSGYGLGWPTEILTGRRAKR